jgi:hypothetical protein
MAETTPVLIYGDRIIFVSIFFCLLLFSLIIFLVRKKMIHENYALVWMLMPVALALFASNRFVLERLAALAGIYYAPSVLLPVLYVLFIFVMLFFTVVLTKRDRQIKDISQELGILKNEVCKLRQALESLPHP